MDLGDYNELKALEALQKAASSASEERTILQSCAESIAEICVGLRVFDAEAFKKLVPFAQKIVFEMIMARKPELIDQQFQKEFSEKFDLR